MNSFLYIGWLVHLPTHAEPANTLAAEIYFFCKYKNCGNEDKCGNGMQVVSALLLINKGMQTSPRKGFQSYLFCNCLQIHNF